jgi:uncharacterized protein (TIGR02147 family)
MRVYSFQDYREYIQAQIRTQPKEGRGVLLKIARAAQMHPSTLSQVFQKTRDLTNEQAAALAEYFELSDHEAQYLLLLVQLDRAGTEKLRSLLRGQLEQLRGEANQLVKRLPVDRVLSFEEKAVFYSNWYYSAARVLSSVPEFQSVEKIAERLNLPRSKAVEIVDFLLSHGLCVEEKGKLNVGPQSTHIEATSPLVTRHHANWRLKAMERHPSISAEQEVAYTSPMSISREGVLKVREVLTQAIEKACDIVDTEAPAELYCLNVDWFQIM